MLRFRSYFFLLKFGSINLMHPFAYKCINVWQYLYKSSNCSSKWKMRDIYIEYSIGHLKIRVLQYFTAFKQRELSVFQPHLPYFPTKGIRISEKCMRASGWRTVTPESIVPSTTSIHFPHSLLCYSILATVFLLLPLVMATTFIMLSNPLNPLQLHPFAHQLPRLLNY